LVSLLITLVVCASLAPGSVLADGPGSTPAIPESTIESIESIIGGALIPQSTLESILGDALPAPAAGVSFSVEKVSGVGLRQELKNVYPYLAYASNNRDDFYPTPPMSDFTVGVDPLCLLAYFAILNHPFQGMAVIHLLYNYGGGEHFWVVQDVPDFYGEPGQLVRFAGCWPTTPNIPGQYLYIPIFIPYDGDGYYYNPQTGIWPVTIR
jgi:hypothetical protein